MLKLDFNEIYRLEMQMESLIKQYVKLTSVEDTESFLLDSIEYVNSEEMHLTTVEDMLIDSLLDK